MNVGERPVLEFWFEFASPYSYIASARIGQLCAEAGVALVWKPFLLGPVFQRQGWNTSHYNLNPWRGAYMWRDMERLTHKYGLPWKRPEVFPQNSVVPSRVAAAFSAADWLPLFVERIYVANFRAGADLRDVTVVRSALERAGADAVDVLQRAGGSLRGKLRENTQHALQIGLFGAPNCVVAGELFWGEETLEDAVEWAKASVQPVHHETALGVYRGPEL